MEIKHYADKGERPLPYQLWLVVGALTIALAGMLLTVPMRTVQADTLALVAKSSTGAGQVVSQPTPMLKQEAAAAAPSVFERGVASWYGSVFHGRLTASGERFNMYAMTACHPTLPFGTLVKVTDLENKRTVVVKITDRGYLYPGRIIDLSYGAAKKLHMTEGGLADVSLEVLSPGFDKR